MNHKRNLKIEKKFLNYPVKDGNDKCWVSLYEEGKLFREFEIELAGENEDFWVFTDVSDYYGKTIEIEVSETNEEGLINRIIQTDEIKDSEIPYKEKYRPQLHFTSRRGWLNDPNGLHYFDGNYHMFYQHNPYGCKWGNMHWGHSISNDLIHWCEKDDALVPDEMGAMFSGSAVTDGNRQILFYTADTGSIRLSKEKRTVQCMAISEDKGITFRKHENNPVIGHVISHNRDPKVVWHKEINEWIMALYLDENFYALFSSKNLFDWEMFRIYSMEGCAECPDIFELPVNDDINNSKWVFYGANSTYFITDSIDKNFKKAQNEKKNQMTDTTYAAQTFYGEPNGRIIQVSWGRFEFPGMPFNMFLTLPCKLSLRTYNDEIFLCCYPVEEIEKLYKRRYEYIKLNVENEFVFDIGKEELFDITFECENKDFVLEIKGEKIKYECEKKQIFFKDKIVDVKIIDKTFNMRVIVDNTIVEVFINAGLYYFVEGTLFENNCGKIKVIGNLSINKLIINELDSIWKF